MLKTTKHLLALALSAAMLLGSPGMLTAFADNGDDLAMAKSLSVQTMTENGNEISHFIRTNSSSASLTVSIRGEFYNPNTQTHQSFDSLRVTTTIDVEEGTNPEYPVSYWFEKRTYWGSPQDPHYGEEGYILIVKIGDTELDTANAWVFNRDMSDVSGDGQTFYPIYNPSLHGTYQNTLFIYGGTPIPDPGVPEEPTAPDKPEVDDIIKNLENVVRVDCVNSQIDPQHECKDYSLISDTFSVGDVENEGTNEEPQWQVIISLNDSAPYVTAYNESIGVEHTRNDENDSRTITLEYNADSEREWKWEITSETPVVYEVICKNTTPDPGPDTPDPTPNPDPDPAPDPTPNPEPQPDPDPDPDRPSRPNRDDDDDWEPLPDAPVKEKAETVEVETEVPEQTETQTPVQQPEKHNPETGDASFAPVSLALAAASLSAAALLARKRK